MWSKYKQMSSPSKYGKKHGVTAQWKIRTLCSSTETKVRNLTCEVKATDLLRWEWTIPMIYWHLCHRSVLFLFLFSWAQDSHLSSAVAECSSDMRSIRQDGRTGSHSKRHRKFQEFHLRNEMIKRSKSGTTALKIKLHRSKVYIGVISMSLPFVASTQEQEGQDEPSHGCNSAHFVKSCNTHPHTKKKKATNNTKERFCQAPKPP